MPDDDGIFAPYFLRRRDILAASLEIQPGGVTDFPGGVGVEGIGGDGAYVVGFEYSVNHGHLFKRPR